MKHKRPDNVQFQDGYGHKDKHLETSRNVYHVQYENSYNYYHKVIINVNKKCQIPKAKGLLPQKNLDIRNVHVKYENSINKVKVSKK